MNIQELGTIMEQKAPVKIIVLNNNFLGNVRQWQAMFFNRKYSFTPMLNPDYMKIASAYDIPSRRVMTREELAEAMEMEKKYMLQGIDEFQKIKNSFSSLEEFQMALKTDPDKYGAALPQVSGYTYTESDREEYIQAYSLSSNDTIRNEVNGMDQSLLSIKNKKFPSALPVLTMISSENVQNVPAWETAHRNQLDLESGNHQLYIVNGGHYIWYTNLTQVVQLIDEWRIENHF